MIAFLRRVFHVMPKARHECPVCGAHVLVNKHGLLKPHERT